MPRTGEIVHNSRGVNGRSDAAEAHVVGKNPPSVGLAVPSGGVERPTVWHPLGLQDIHSLRDQLSDGEICRRTGLARNTVKKWLKAPGDINPKYQRRKADGKLTPFAAALEQALRTDAHRAKQARRSGKALFAQIQAQGYRGGYSAVTDFIRSCREISVPRTYFRYGLIFKSSQLSNCERCDRQIRPSPYTLESLQVNVTSRNPNRSPKYEFRPKNLLHAIATNSLVREYESLVIRFKIEIVSQCAVGRYFSLLSSATKDFNVWKERSTANQKPDCQRQFY